MAPRHRSYLEVITLLHLAQGTKMSVPIGLRCRSITESCTAQKHSAHLVLYGEVDEVSVHENLVRRT